jgi:PAS domain S-box-containing protein
MEAHLDQHVIDSIGHGVIFADTTETITYANRYFREITGYSNSEIVGRNCRFLQGEDTCPEAKKRIKEAIENGQRFDGQILNYRKNGEAFWNDLSITPQFDADRELTGFVGIMRDVTERQMHRQRIEKLEQHLRLIFEKIPAGMVVHRADGTIESVNPEGRRLLDLPSSGDIDGLRFEDLNLFAEDGSRLGVDDCLASMVAATGQEMRDLIASIVHKASGQKIWLKCSVFPTHEESGELSAVVLSFSDITHEYESERERQRFELAAQVTKSIVFDWDLCTGEFWANRNFKTIFGFEPPKERNPSDPPHYVFEEDRNDYQLALSRALEQQRSRLDREFRFVKPDGTLGFVRSEVMMHYDDDGQAVRIIGLKRDLTELRRQEERLAESEERMRIVAELSSDLLWELDPETDVVWRARDGVERLGLDPALAPCSGGAWYDLILPEDRERVVASFRQAIENGAGRWREEYRIERADKSALQVADTAAIIREEGGKPTKVVGAVRDITESRRLDEFLREKQSLESLGKLTGGVAHDFNNMLMIIMGNTEILMDSVEDPETRELLDLIQSAARSGAELTSHLLAFARQQPLAPQHVDIADQMDQVAKLIRYGLPEDISLKIDLTEDNLYVEADPHQLDNALVNLAVNARDAMPDGGRLTVEVSSHSVDAGPLHAVLAPGEYVRITMSDTGPGMTPEIASRVFEPFFTTKERGEGTGLGLSMVYGFAKQSGGHAFIESSPGEGTSASIFLPRISKARFDAESDQDDTSFPLSEGKILIVEDEEQVRHYVERIFESEGLAVLSASNAIEALELLEDHHDVDLLVTDIVMPGGMNGLQLAETARRRLPGLKVLLTSGNASMGTLREGFDRRRDTLLPKPYTREALARAVSRVMSKPEAR